MFSSFPARSRSSFALIDPACPAKLVLVRDLRRLPLFALVLALGVAFGVPSALGQSVWEQQQSLDSKIAGLQSEISRAKHKEGVLTTEISSSSSQISSLQGDIGALTAKVASYQPDVVVSSGFMRIVSPEFIDTFHGKYLNTHPALLPSFPGAHGVRDAMAYGVKVTGCTVHWADAGVDTGPIIAQEAVAIEDGDTEETLHERIKVVERRLLVSTLGSLAAEYAAAKTPNPAQARLKSLLAHTVFGVGLYVSALGSSRVHAALS